MQSRLESTPSQVSRPLGKLEEFFKMLYDSGTPWNREHWLISLTLSLNTPSFITDLEPYLRRAWYVIRLQYPALGAVIGDTKEDTNDSPQLILEELNVSAEVWTNRTFVADMGIKDADELFRKQHPETLATCHWLPSTGQLMIRSSHWRIDGVGMLMLADQFMKSLSDAFAQGLDTPPDAHVTHHPHEHILGVNLQDTVKSLKKPLEQASPSLLDEGADVIIGKLLQGMPSIGLPTRRGSEGLPPGTSDRVTLRLDADTTARIVTSCRLRGISITSAVHAAIVCATAKFPQHSLARAYASFAAADLRRVLHTYDQQIDVEPLGLFHLGLPICIKDVVSSEGVGLAKDFEDVAREFHAVYSQDLINFWGPSDGGARKIAFFELAEAVPRKTMELFSQPLPPELPPAQTPDLSSLGRLEKFIQRQYECTTDSGSGMVEVTDCWLGTEMVTRAMQFHVWSWRDELKLAVCFNTAFYETPFATRMLELVREELVSGLKF